MNILIIGSGGREHALAKKISESNITNKLFIAPGNPGTAIHGKNANLNILDFPKINDFCKKHNIQLVIIGPENPLVEGIADFLTKEGINVVGPHAEASQLEGSKAYAKRFMEEFGIPTASYREFDKKTLEEGLNFIENSPIPIVLKADGLAAGKGVIISYDKDDAKREFSEMLSGKFGSAGSKVVIESFLDGIEFSVFAITDGESYILLPEAKDYKRIGEGDIGLNTGGMGAVSPVPIVNNEMMLKVEKRIIKPTIDGIKARGLNYKGFVFFGLISVKGEPFVIEYNCRMGDPETEVVIPRLKSDLVQILDSLFTGKLSEQKAEFITDAASTVMLVSGGYPEKYEKGVDISINDNKKSLIFHAGTKTIDEGLQTNGGRVLAITSFGKTIFSALETSYETIEGISFNKMYYRKDLGKDLSKF